MNSFPNFTGALYWAEECLFAGGKEVDAGRWQGLATDAHPSLITRELLNIGFEVPVDRATANVGTIKLLDFLADEIQPNREWADEHFAERVGGKPLNPDPSHERWPWWKGQDDTTKKDGVFTHTYSERFWPKHANYGRQVYYNGEHYRRENTGIRYDYGDYTDVIELLRSNPQTRQAYLPIFFPEDTGAVHGGRTPCTLGYHFLLRDDQLHMWYDIRSCDAVRHFRDDVYLAVRLQLHTLQEIQTWAAQTFAEEYNLWASVKPGKFYFCAHSFHVHMGDFHLLREKVNGK